MGVTPKPDDGEPTVEIPAEIARWLASSRRARRRRLALSAVTGIVFIAGMAAGWVFFLRNERSLVVSGQPAREVASPQVMRPASQPVPPPSRTSDKPSSPRQMLKEIFEGRNRGHSVTALVDGGAVRISSTRSGYVYVLAASADESSDAPVLFAAVLFPRAADANNRIRPGHTLKLPDLQWPTNAEFLAIVSDEPRDIDVLGPLAGKVICASATRCSESYGAVVFSHDGARNPARSPVTSTAPAARPTSKASRRCSDILERASLGEPLTDEEQTFLRRDCR